MRACLLLSLLALLGCGADPFDTSGSGLEILVVGIDGADFDVIEPMLPKGELPHLAGLMERGTHAPLLSLEHTWSPAVWTTVATGVLPEQHGIRWFEAERESDAEAPRLVASSDRQRLAIWNLLGAFGLDAGVVGWWVTWPAEPVSGVMVSDRLAHSRYQAWTEGKQTAHLTHPPELAAELQPLVVDPLSPPMEEIDALVELTPEERAEFLAVDKPILYHGLSVLKWGYCTQRTYERVALELLSRRQPDLAMVFLIGVDPVSHTFWHYYQPERFDGGVDPEKAARLGRLIPAMYAHSDRTLGALLERVDDDTVVFVVSDHGFRAAPELPRRTRVVTRTFGRQERIENPVLVGQSGIHRLYGIFVAAGGPILAGAKPRVPPTVADVMPTILALLGLPVPRDLDGRVLEELVDPAFWEAHPVRRIDSYEGVVPRPRVEASDAAPDSEQSEYLRALGYIE